MTRPSPLRVEDAYIAAEALQLAGWRRVECDTIALMRASGSEPHYEFCSSLTGVVLDDEKNAVDILWDLWCRRRLDAPPMPDVSTCYGQERSDP